MWTRGCVLECRYWVGQSCNAIVDGRVYSCSVADVLCFFYIPSGSAIAGRPHFMCFQSSGSAISCPRYLAGLYLQFSLADLTENLLAVSSEVYCR
jgi:hypothetical protein